MKKFFPLVIMCMSVNAFADESVFPTDKWQQKMPIDVNIDPLKVERLFDLSFQDPSTQSVVLIKNGFLIGERYAEGANASSYGTSWSMAKSFYAALIGISIDLGEIDSLDDRVSKYLEYFNDERSDITIRDVLNMASGLQYPENQHENMFFLKDQLAYAKSIMPEKETQYII